MNIKHISLAISAFAALLVGCAKNPIEDVNPSEQFTDLELSYVGSTETKVVIDGTEFPQTGEIGLFLFQDEMATKAYGVSGYTNVKYTYNSTRSKWTASPPIKVGSTPGYLYGYYPYSGTITDIKAIPVSSSLNGNDVMYASKQDSPITDMTASQTNITMNHALARVTITVKNNGYSGSAELTSIQFEEAKTSETGTLDATTGTISGTTRADVTLTVPKEKQTITKEGTVYECLLVPSGVDLGTQSVDLALTIDGEKKKATLSGDNGVIIAQGTKSNITITLSDTGITVQTVSVEKWNVVEVGGHYVTIQMADGVLPHDILTEAYADGSTVIIRALSNAGKHLKCTLPGGELCPQSKTDNLVYTFTMSDIKSDIAATIGYANALSISSTVSPEGAGTIRIVGDSYEGETVTLLPEATYKYGIDCWKNQKGEMLSDGYGYTIRLPQDELITAYFKNNLILDGVFTVGQNQVKFTRGNIYYEWPNTCNIEQRQYDFNSADYTNDYNHLSHFMWCNNINRATAKEYFSDWISLTPFFANEQNFTVSGFSSGDCYALSNWDHLLNNRNASTVNGIENARFFKGCIQKEDGTTINGLFIFPDEFTWPSSVTTKPSGINDGTTGFTTNTYNFNDFKRLQDAGIVFLPAAGYRYSGNTKLDEVGNTGYYWTSYSGSDSPTADFFYFKSEELNSNTSKEKKYAFAVRLVINYQSAPSGE